MRPFARPTSRLALTIAAALGLVAGCARQQLAEPLPTYPLTDPQTSLNLLRERTADLASVSGQGSVTLRSPTRGSVTLESAFVLRPPGDARVRAWKFNQAVFDLTVRPDGVWVYVPREQQSPDASPGELTRAGNGLSEPVRQWMSLLLGEIDTRDATVTARPDAIVIVSPQDDGTSLWLLIDRPTITLREQSLLDASGNERFRMRFGKYRTFGSTLWPSEIVATSPNGGTITINTSKLTTNDAPDTAFTPPRRATKLQ